MAEIRRDYNRDSKGGPVKIVDAFIQAEINKQEWSDYADKIYVEILYLIDIRIDN